MPQPRRSLPPQVHLASVQHDDFAAVFYPGGHGPLWDLAEDPHSIQLLEAFVAAGKPVALVCHAPGALRHVRQPDGSPLVAGKRFTGFSNTEEAAMHRVAAVPFILEDDWQAEGGHYLRAADSAPYVVTGGLLTHRAKSGLIGPGGRGALAIATSSSGLIQYTALIQGPGSKQVERISLNLLTARLFA